MKGRGPDQTQQRGRRPWKHDEVGHVGGDMSDTALSGIAADEVAGPESERTNHQSMYSETFVDRIACCLMEPTE